jgi:hypothetical protein
MEEVLRQSAEYKRLCRTTTQLYTLIVEGVLSDRQTIEMIKNRYMKINGSLQTKIRSSSIRKVQGKQVDDVYLEALIENISVRPWHTLRVYISVQMVRLPKRKYHPSNDANRINRRWSRTKTLRLT